MLDTLAIIKYPGRIAAIEMHTRLYADTLLYCLEAYQRWQSLPGNHIAPQLYIDGHRHPGWYWQWEDSTVARMNLDAPVTITMTGSYNPGTRQGTITAQYRNDSTTTINGRVMFVTVEDSIYYMDSLGGQMKDWHNHTARDYIPGPLGTMISIAPGDSVSYTQPFTIQPSWQYDYCSIITFIQDTILRPDTVTQNIWQGAMIKVSQLIGIEENPAMKKVIASSCIPSPNPCTDRTRFSISVPTGAAFKLSIFDVVGRCIKSYTSISQGDEEYITWDCRDENNVRVGTGIYLYVFEDHSGEITGKIVVR